MPAETNTTAQRILARSRLIAQMVEEGWELDAASAEADRMIGHIMKEVNKQKSKPNG